MTQRASTKLQPNSRAVAYQASPASPFLREGYDEFFLDQQHL